MAGYARIQRERSSEILSERAAQARVQALLAGVNARHAMTVCASHAVPSFEPDSLLRIADATKTYLSMSFSCIVEVRTPLQRLFGIWRQ